MVKGGAMCAELGAADGRVAGVSRSWSPLLSVAVLKGRGVASPQPALSEITDAQDRQRIQQGPMVRPGDQWIHKVLRAADKTAILTAHSEEDEGEEECCRGSAHHCETSTGCYSLLTAKINILTRA